MRDRLIKLLDNAVIGRGTYLADGTLVDVCGEKAVDEITAIALADYLLQNGVVVPPCRLNQKMWVTDGFEVNECKVSSLTQKADGSFKIRLTYFKYRSVFEITVDKIGKTVFLTREAAEQALKGGAE